MCRLQAHVESTLRTLSAELGGEGPPSSPTLSEGPMVREGGRRSGATSEGDGKVVWEHRFGVFV